MPRLYSIWPGNNRFFCGCCVTGPSKDWIGVAYIYTTTAIILIPFCIFVVGQNWTVTPVLPIIFFTCLFFTYLFLYLTSCSDPGIIPRKPFMLRQSQKYQRYLSSINPADVHKFCQSCHIFRPKKASHCSSCQNCVEVFDHHCGIVGTCIGKRNYRFFIMFLASLCITFILLISNMVVFIILKLGSGISQTAIIIIVSVVGSVIGLPIIAFFSFHIYLACTGRTTREVLKNIQQQVQQPQNQWCDIEPPIIDFYEQISEEEAMHLKEQIRKLREENGFQPAQPAQQTNEALNI